MTVATVLNVLTLLEVLLADVNKVILEMASIALVSATLYVFTPLLLYLIPEMICAGQI